MTFPPRFKAMQERCDAATDGPWKATHRHCELSSNDDEAVGLGLEVEGPPEASNRGQFSRGADARFIAHSRTDVPDLLWSVGVALEALKQAEESWKITHLREVARKAIAKIKRGRDAT